MAFNAANFSKWSPFNELGPQQFGYFTTTDNVATVSTSTYFTPFADSVLQSYLPFPINVGDTIQCTCTDGNVAMTVTSINPIATTEETETIVIGPNSVNTAAIQNLAVIAAKIANGTITTTQISNTAGITGAQIAATTIAAANIANATITHTQISATAAITGSQLSASAGITGSQLAANTIATSSLDPTTIQYVRVPMTAAQWNGMYGAPYLLVAAPGANKIIVVKQALMSMTFVAAQYANGGVVGLQYDSTVHGAGTLASGTVAAATVQGYAASSCTSVGGVVTSSANTTTVNKGLYLSNDTAAFDTGDGTWNIFIWYSIVSV